jgi:hypothetical protein
MSPVNRAAAKDLVVATGALSTLAVDNADRRSILPTLPEIAAEKSAIELSSDMRLAGDFHPPGQDVIR